MNLKKLFTKSPLSTQKSTLPTLKEYFNLERWAFSNNFYIHPEYVKASRIKNKIITILSVIGTIISMIILKVIVSIISILMR